MIQLTIYILSQALFNLINAYFDAYRILKNKTIAHAINFGCYAVIVGIQLWLSGYTWWYMIIFCFMAFVNRQNTFDIPLNLRRNLEWDYVTKANPPAAWWDRQEIKVFGYNGNAIAWSYIILFTVSTAALFILN